MKINFKITLVSSQILLMLLLLGCGDTNEVPPEDLCEEVVCLNEGNCDNGECLCINGFSGENCEISPASELSLRTAFGSINTLSVATNGIYAIWWDPKFDHSGDLDYMFQRLNEIRTDCIDNLAMADPPNPGAGYFYNVYIHHGEDDLLPSGWGNGQGTDQYGMPFLTLPDGAHLEYGNLLHEGFHIFQYSANSPGFTYSGDSQWYVESAAQWYSATKEPSGLYTFIEAGAIISNPHLALWHSFSNQAPGDPVDWMFQVRQYGMHTYLYYLAEYAQVSGDIISGGFYANTSLLPQNYHYTNIGGDNLRGYFADWAAHNTAEIDYLSREQYDRALLEVELAGDVNNAHPYVIEVSDSEAEGVFSPPAPLIPRGWSYNVLKINNTETIQYTIKLLGEATGSEGANAHFESRLVIEKNNGFEFIELPMTSDLNGQISLKLSPEDKTIYVVVAAVPEHFTGNQTYNYQVEISRE